MAHLFGTLLQYIQLAKLIMNQQQSTLNIQGIVKAFETVANRSQQKQAIKAADQYISQCETYPQFALLLMSIFTQTQNQQTKQQILIHLKNVIKRNWTAKRRSASGCVMTTQIKQQIKGQILQVYKQDWRLHYKQFNEIFRYLAREDFPINYPQLNEFVKQVLSGLASYSMDQILGSQELLPYLSLVKVIYKQYAKRKMLHSVDSFIKYSASTIEISKEILTKINQAFQIIRSDPQKIQSNIVIRLLECSRKIDKIVLYCLQSMVHSLQYNQQIIELLGFLINKVKMLLSLSNPDLREQIELNVVAIIQFVAKLQAHFPLLFAQFLTQYLQLIIQLLFSQAFNNEKLINFIVHANTVPLTSFPYYMDKSQFMSSLEYKKDGNENLHQSRYQLCHQIFNNFYNSTSIKVMLQKIVGELMVKYPRQNEDDQIIFEDVDPGYDDEQPTFQLLINLIKAIAKRFPKQTEAFVVQVINHLINTPEENPNSRVRMSMYQIALWFPKFSEEIQDKLSIVFVLMEKCFRSQNLAIFCRFIRNYQQYFDTERALKSFQILALIISSPTSHLIVYQSSACIRKLLQDHDEVPFPFKNVGKCIGRIFSLIQIYIENPSHLWNLLHLLIQILKVLDIQVILASLGQINGYINMLVEKKANNNMIVSALAQLLQNILGLINREDTTYLESKFQLYEISLKLVCNNSIQEEEEMTEMAKHWLWLCVVKNVNVNACPQILKSHLLEMLKQLQEKVINSDLSVFCELVQWYMISGVLQMTSQDLLHIYQTMIQQLQLDNEIRTIVAFFSMCYSHCLLTNKYDIKMAVICMKRLTELYGKVSPSLNTLRMLLMLIISNFIIVMGADFIFASFNQLYPNYRDWFWPFVSSFDYISNKYAAKLTTIGIFKGFDSLKEVFKIKIQENLPFDNIIKFITLNTAPLNHEQAMNGYLSSMKLFSHLEDIKSRIKSNSDKITNSRKVKLHVNQLWCDLDLTGIYREKITPLFQEWNWGVDDLEERYTKNTVLKIVELLQGSQTGQMQTHSQPQQ